MNNHYLKKGFAVGIICLLMLVSIPMVTGEDILYPKEEGPYNVFISGKCTGMGGRLYPMFLHPSPLWLLVYPLSIEWHFYEDYVFFVNGEKQDIDYRVQIDLTGFKGYGPSFYMLLLKEKVGHLFFKLTGSITTPRARIIGRCAEILVIDMR